jgi:pimeloyl-ACP methyl ester carboxylesterase
VGGMTELGILHGCCKAHEDPRKNKSSADVIGEGREAASHLGVDDPLLPYYTCVLNRLSQGEGHKVPLPADCRKSLEGPRNATHDDRVYEEWLSELERQSLDELGARGRNWLGLGDDVHVYLDHRDTRPPVCDEVMKQLPKSSYVLVAHSLGSIIAIDLIREQRTNPSALVTVGSPLGLPLITRWVLPMQLSIPWVNITDERDIVTARMGFTPKRNGFDGRFYRDVWVDNPELDGDHDLIGYLSQRGAIDAIKPLLTATNLS